MSYKNARDILPQALLEELQRYAEGSCLYVPRRDGGRLKWGEATETKDVLSRRNRQIQREYGSATVKELAERYFLSEKTIRKILKKTV